MYSPWAPLRFFQPLMNCIGQSLFPSVHFGWFLIYPISFTRIFIRKLTVPSIQNYYSLTDKIYDQINCLQLITSVNAYSELSWTEQSQSKFTLMYLQEYIMQNAKTVLQPPLLSQCNCSCSVNNGRHYNFLLLVFKQEFTNIQCVYQSCWMAIYPVSSYTNHGKCSDS